MDLLHEFDYYCYEKIYVVAGVLKSLLLIFSVLK